MLKIFAPAKINLHFHITGKKPDGYHLVDSLVCFADVGDYLTFENHNGFELSIDGPFAKNLSEEDRDSSPTSGNTVARAAWLLAHTLKRELNVRITLTKNLPTGAGIGGGSADAAACLWGLCQFWGLNLSETYLQEIGLKIGSDVPVCIKSMSVIMQGTGDLISAAPDLPEIPVLLIWPNQKASTKDVFQSFTSEKFSENAGFRKTYETVRNLAFDLEMNTRNDLYEPSTSLFPVIAEALDCLKNNSDCVFHRMTGSGSTVFGFFGNEAQSEKAMEEIANANADWWVRACWLNRIARY